MRVQRTWLGRIKVEAVSPRHAREVVINRTTGEILRDYWHDRDKGPIEAEAPRIGVAAPSITEATDDDYEPPKQPEPHLETAEIGKEPREDKVAADDIDQGGHGPGQKAQGSDGSGADQDGQGAGEDGDENDPDPKDESEDDSEDEDHESDGSSTSGSGSSLE